MDSVFCTPGCIDSEEKLFYGYADANMEETIGVFPPLPLT